MFYGDHDPPKRWVRRQVLQHRRQFPNDRDPARLQMWKAKFRDDYDADMWAMMDKTMVARSKMTRYGTGIWVQQINDPRMSFRQVLHQMGYTKRRSGANLVNPPLSIASWADVEKYLRDEFVPRPTSRIKGYVFWNDGNTLYAIFRDLDTKLVNVAKACW